MLLSGALEAESRCGEKVCRASFREPCSFVLSQKRTGRKAHRTANEPNWGNWSDAYLIVFLIWRVSCRRNTIWALKKFWFLPVYSTVATQDSLLLSERVWLVIYRERDAFAYTCKSESVPGLSVSSLVLSVDSEAAAMSWRNASRLSLHDVSVLLSDGQSILKMTALNTE